MEAETQEGPFANYFATAFHQNIRFINPSKHVDRLLDLAQHRSGNPDLQGRLSLDGVATNVICLTSTHGRTYLYVPMYCANAGATTCKIGMGAPDSEWMILFDDRGHRLLADPVHESIADTRRFRRLGLDALVNGAITLSDDSWIFH